MSLEGLGLFNTHNREVGNNLPIGGRDDGLSTTTLLLGGGTFNIGAGKVWFDMSCWAEMLVTAEADVISAVNGLLIQWSHDGGTTVDATLTTAVTLAAGIPYYQAFARRARHVSVAFTNGAGAQASFYLYTHFFQTPSIGGAIGGSLAVSPLFSPLAGRTENIADNLVHELSRAAGAGLDMGKTYVVQPTAGEGIGVLEAAAAPAVATIRAQGVVIYAREAWPVSIQVQGNRLWAVKLVDGTANTDVKCVSMNGGGGVI